jgi:hypothetical protein
MSRFEEAVRHDLSRAPATPPIECVQQRGRRRRQRLRTASVISVLTALVLVVVIIIGAPNAPSQVNVDPASPHVTTRTTGDVAPPGVVLVDGWTLVSSGRSAGVNWFFAKSTVDTEMGICREFDFMPALRERHSDSLHPGQIVIGAGDEFCQTDSLQIPINRTDSHSPVLIAEHGSSTDHSYSVIAGEVAPGVTTVVVRFPDGSSSTIRPDAEHAFVMISKPERPDPVVLLARWPHGESSCRPDGAGGFDCALSRLG